MRNRFFLKLCWVLQLILIVSVAAAQEYPMVHFSVDEGLPSLNVYSIYRDTKGFLWFATDKGVARYNGAGFETFTTSDGLADNEVFLFKEDYQGRLWMSTYNGELCYYKNGVFYSAANAPYLKMPFKKPHIYNITLEFDSSLTFNFFDDLMMLNIKYEQMSVFSFTSVKRPPDDGYIYYKRKIEPNVIELVYREDIVLVDTLGHILSRATRKHGGASIYVPTQDSGYFHNIHSIRPGNQIQNDGLIYSQQMDIIASFREPVFQGKEFRAYYSDGVNNFFATSNGLVINNRILILQGKSVSSMTQDAAGNYWISTLNSGVYCLRNNFLSTRFISSQWDGEVKYIKAVAGGVFFVAGNCNVYWLKDGQVSLCLNYMKLSKDSVNLHSEDAFFIDSSGTWYADFKKYQCLTANFKSGSERFILYRSDTISSGVKDVFRHGDIMYLFGRTGIEHFSFDDFKHGRMRYKYIYSTGNQRIYGITASNRFGVWFSTLTGVYRLLGDTAVRVQELKETALKHFVFAGSALVGYTHKNQLLISRFTPGGAHTDTVPSQSCVWDKIYPIDSANLLISTNNQYRLLTLRNDYSYDLRIVEDAFIPRQANAICIDSTNCHFLKEGEITTVPKYSLLKKATPPKLYFTRIRTGSEVPDIVSPLQGAGIEFSYGESRNINVAFAKVVTVGRTAKQQYSFSKDGQEQWNDISSEDISLVNTGYGDFTLQIRAKTASSDYCAPIVLKVHIFRPFWAQWWFVLVVGFLFVTVVVVAVRLRVRFQLRKKEKAHQNEMKFVKSEYKALNALMNPHFVFNTLNNVQGLVNRDDKLAANEYIRVFADLIRQNMHNLSKEMIPLSKEIELVVNYLLLEKLRFKDLLNYSIKVDDDLDLSEIMVPPLLVQPLVENSIKHGILPLESIEGVVNIHIYERNNILSIEVRDNGVGPTKAKEINHDTMHESFAMANIKKRIEQLAVILDKQITLDMREEQVPGEERQWTIVTVGMSNF